MSHISRIKTQISDKTALLQALTDLGYTYEEEQPGLQITGGTPVDIKIPLRLSYDIGFRRKGETYEIVADWWGVRNINPEKFKNNLTQRYAYLVTRNKLEAQGFILSQEEKQKDGAIRLVLRRTA